jgi:hypothetical protein
MKLALVLVNLLIVSVAWGRGPFNFPDRLECTINDQAREGYFRQMIDISFPHIEAGQGQYVTKAKVEVTDSADNQTYKFQNVDLHLTFSEWHYPTNKLIELRTAFASIDGKPLFIISQKKGISLFTPISIDQKWMPLNSEGDGCIYLDGTAARPGLSGSN